ncbi:MAG: ABC transporter permease, partial [Fulvivirga sp.]|nr:ABC transporter permease [Fulvivirga sp.]
MLKNYLKTTVRNLLKSKGFTFILIFGLVSGLSAAFLIYIYVDFETSYDTYHPKADQLYRIYTANYDDEKGIYTYKDAMSFNLSGPTLKEEIPEITHFGRAFDVSSGLNLRIDDQVLLEKEAMFVDSGFVELFGIKWLKGNPEIAFSNTYSMILTEKAAKKYFGDSDPMGQMIEVTSGQFEGTYQVNGLIKNTSSNTHLYFDVLLSYPTIWQSGIEPNWNNFVDYTYFRVVEDTDMKALNEKLFPLSKKYLSENTALRFQLQKAKDIHLYSSMSYEAEINGDASTVYFLSVIAIFILVIAWINYINLSTAKAMERAAETTIGSMTSIVGLTGAQVGQIVDRLDEVVIANEL